LLVIAGAVLLYLGTIDFTGAMAIWVVAGSATGINLAYKAPSPTQQAETRAQQAQIGAHADALQQIASQALQMLPAFANLLHSHAPANVAPPAQVPAGYPGNVSVSPPVASPQPTQTPNALAPTVAPVVPNTPLYVNPNATGTTTTTAFTQRDQPTPTVALTQPGVHIPIAEQIQVPGVASLPRSDPSDPWSNTNLTRAMGKPPAQTPTPSTDPWSNTGIMRALNATVQPPQQ